jgi:hypothetical protein
MWLFETAHYFLAAGTAALHSRYRLVFFSLAASTCMASDNSKASARFDELLEYFESPASGLSSECSAAQPELGASLLQASSQRTLLVTGAYESTTAATDFPAAVSGPQLFLIMFLVIAVLGGLMLYRDSQCTKEDKGQSTTEDHPEQTEDGQSSEDSFGKTNALAPPPRKDSTATSANEAYEVEAEESDTGEWQVEDFLGMKSTEVQEVPTDMKEYDQETIPRFLAERYGSWKLFFQVAGGLGEFWVALAFMYWSLLNREEEMMSCRDPRHASMTRHLCLYTTACLRGFPILAANFVLVLMIRILVQNRFYYSMLKLDVALDFASTPVLKTLWPWAIGLSMLQGALHFVLKVWFEPETVKLAMYARLVRKFVLPGTIFFTILMRYSDIENTLVPLNRILKQDYTMHTRNCPWVSKIQVLNERVLAFDARHRDVIGSVMKKLGRAPTVADVVENLVSNYDVAQRCWDKRKHRSWGLFRSMWPTGVLVDKRLDRTDPDTRAWLCAFGILAAGCLVVCVLSLWLLFLESEHSWIGLNVLSRHVWRGEFALIESESALANFVLCMHGLAIVIFIQRAIRNMFYKLIADSPVLEQMESLSRSMTDRLRQTQQDLQDLCEQSTAAAATDDFYGANEDDGE